MKKTILIAIGTIITLTIIGVWYYLFTYGAPKNSDEIFARFGIGGDDEVIPANTEPVTEQPTESQVTPEKKRLRQLTLKPAAGAVFRGSSIRYVEQGTGHIYDINLESTTETLIGGKTIPRTRDAQFSNDGSHVAITSFIDDSRQTLVREVNEPDTTGTEREVKLPLGTRDIKFDTNDTSFSYIVPSRTQTDGYRYTFAKERNERLFAIPLRDVRAVWGLDTYVYTTPSNTEGGYLYKIKGNELEYTEAVGTGAMALPYKNDIIYTTLEKGVLTSKLLSASRGTTTQKTLPLSLIPEKCTSQNELLVCAVPTVVESATKFPDNWYKGVVSYSDALWIVDALEYRGTLLSDLLSEGGREVDIYKIGIDSEGKRVWFINKNDNTLWMYDMSI